MKASCVASLFSVLRQTSWHVPTALFTLCLFAMAPNASAVETCPPKAPVATGSRATVVYDPADSSMKACVAGAWLALSGGGGGGGPLDGLTDVTITAPALNHVLLYNGGAWVNSPVTVTESDPQVGTLTANKWCAANAGATAIDCTQDAPSGGGTSSGSAGYVQFSGGSGAFASDSNLVWDNTNKGLGVGRAVGPSETAVLRNEAGKGVMIGGGTTGNDGTTALYVHANAAAQYGLILRPAASATVPVLDIQSDDGSASLLTVLSSGRVGIGTATPMTALHVKGGEAGIFLEETTGGANNEAYLVHYNNNFQIQNRPSNNSFSVVPYSLDIRAPASTIVASSSGNVGIGTPSPATRFSVSPSSTSPEFRIYSDCGGLSYTAVSLIGGAADCSTYNLLSDGNHLFINRPTGKIYFRSSNVDQMILGSTGLSVVGAISSGGNIIADASASIGNGPSAFSIFTLSSKTASGVGYNPYIQWYRDATRQAYMGWGTPGASFHIQMESGNQLQITNPWGAVFSSDDVRKPSGGAFVASSDARLKDIGEPYMAGLDAIAKLNPVNYRYKKDNPRNEPSNKDFVGLVAQDVEQVFPKAVKQDRDGYLSLDPSEFTYALINAVKELKAANDQLRAEFEAYKAANP